MVMFLYGDSSQAPLLKTNLIEVLRATIEFSVRALIAQQNISEQRERADAFRQAAAVDLGRLEAIETLVQRALAGASPGASDSPASRCSDSIARAASQLVQVERGAVRERLETELAHVEAETAQHGSACARALGVLLERHDLPDASNTIQLRANASGHYDADLTGETPYGLVSSMTVEADARHLLGQVLKIERIVERLEVHAPEQAGWLQKTTKLRTHRLDRMYLTGLLSRAGTTTLRLRALADGSGEGFDVIVAAAGDVSLQRVGENGETRDETITPEADECAPLRALSVRLVELAEEIARGRRVLREARVDGERLEAIADPRIVVERLIAALSPPLQEISRRSVAPGELVLKKVVAGDRREEYFVSKSELLEKISIAPEEMQDVFAPLGLDATRPSQGAVAVPVTAAVLAPSRAAVPVVATVPPPASPAPEPAITDDGPALEMEEQGEDSVPALLLKPRPGSVPEVAAVTDEGPVIDISASSLEPVSHSQVAVPGPPPLRVPRPSRKPPAPGESASGPGPAGKSVRTGK